MIHTDRWQIHHRVDGGEQVVFAANEARCQAWLDERPDGADFTLRRQPFCSCCGAVNDFGHRQDVVLVRDTIYGPLYRCARHRDFNPCAVDGCSRTRGIAHGYYDDALFLCGEHWKIGCPPRSAIRQVYRRLFRLHEKRDGKDQPWSADLDRRYWRVWGAIVRRARGATAGDIDMNEINAMFGWGDGAAD